MFVYVAAGGTQIGNSLTIDSIHITLTRPRVFQLLIPIVSVYASLRYWWYAIKIPLTRNKIRRYLRHTRSLLICKVDKNAYALEVKRQSPEFLACHMELETKVPPSLTPYDFIVFTDAVIESDKIYMFHLCRNRIEFYFPGITTSEFVLDKDGDHHAWASPSNLRYVTKIRAFIENMDLWFPVIINCFGLLFFAIYLWLSSYFC